MITACHCHDMYIPKKTGKKAPTQRFIDFWPMSAPPAADKAAAHALWLEGKALLKTDALADAVEKFAKALETYTGGGTDAAEDAPPLDAAAGPYYLEYGLALLAYGQSQNDIFGPKTKEMEKAKKGASIGATLLTCVFGARTPCSPWRCR